MGGGGEDDTTVVCVGTRGTGERPRVFHLHPLWLEGTASPPHLLILELFFAGSFPHPVVCVPDLTQAGLVGLGWHAGLIQFPCSPALLFSSSGCYEG